MKTLVCFSMLLLGLANLPAQAREATQPSALATSLSCQLPAAAPAAGAGQTPFDEYSWQLFVALNWPAQDGQRGSPDCTKQPGGGGYTVWQTYKSVEEIFLPNAANPGPWNSVLTARSLGLINIAALKNTSLQNHVDQAIGGWLIDQAGNPTYYDIAANETSYNYIVANNFYNANVVSNASSIKFPNGVIEVKSSWRILTSKDNASRYLNMIAQVTTFDAQGKPNGVAQQLLGLVGLHIITKPAGYPQWVWSTFEQIDNVPADPSTHGSYYDPAATTVNQSPCNWNTQGAHPVCVPVSGTTFQTPDPLTRVSAIDSATDKVNATYRADPGLKNSPLKYYQLITTQRPLNPNMIGNPMGTPTPTLSANVTMESYIQPTSSCMACHSMATPPKSAIKSDYSYLFKFAQTPGATPSPIKE